MFNQLPPWNTYQTNGVWDAVAEVAFDIPDLMPQPDYERKVRRALLTVFRKEISQYGVKPHIADMQIVTKLGPPEKNSIQARAIWRPQSTSVEFWGGPQDGTMCEASKKAIMQPIMQLVNRGSLSSVQHDLDEVSPVDKVKYDCVGWRPIERRWLYSTKEIT